MVLAAILVIAASLCVGKALSHSLNNPEKFAFVLLICIIICFLPMSFRIYMTDLKLDKLLWALTLFAVWLTDKKYAVWLCFPLCCIATMVNPVFCFEGMILIAIILLQKFYDSKYSVSFGVLCSVTYLSIIALGVFSVISENKLGFSSIRELIDFYFSRYTGQIEIDMDSFLTEWAFDYDPNLTLIDKFVKAFEIYFVQWENWWRCL